MIPTRRRSFLLSVSTLLATPSRLLAQQPPARPARIGFLKIQPLQYEVEITPFRQGMRELGHVEGKTYVLEVRSADNNYGRVPALAEELVNLKPDVIWVATTPAVSAVKSATRSIPIVSGAFMDPVQDGLVQSFARPGGNLTGPSLMVVDLAGKQLEFLRTVMPKLSRVAFVGGSSKYFTPFLSALEGSARTLGVRISTSGATTTLADFEKAILAARRNGDEALILPTSPAVLLHRKAIADMATRERLATIFPYIEAVQDGGLLCYGPNLADVFRRSAQYVDKILKGAKAADLPIEQPTKFDLGVNLKTASVLDIKMPTSILIQATNVIE